MDARRSQFDLGRVDAYSNVVVLELAYRIVRSSGGRAESLRVRSENVENLMTVVDRLDELQASSVGRRECIAARGSEREPDAWTSM